MAFMKKANFFLIFIVFLLFSCNHQSKNNRNLNETILKKSDLYFSAIDWTSSESILAEPMAEPFSIEEIKKDEIALYSDTNIQESIFPEMDGLETLDYSGIDVALLNFLDKIALQIKEKNINTELCFKDKAFLPFLINYRIKRIDEIRSIYFSRPEYKANKKATTKFRCNIKNTSAETKMSYILLEITVVFTDDKWFIDSFDIIGEYNANSIEQN